MTMDHEELSNNFKKKRRERVSFSASLPEDVHGVFADSDCAVKSKLTLPAPVSLLPPSGTSLLPPPCISLLDSLCSSAPHALSYSPSSLYCFLLRLLHIQP
ncbi:hypothetical protein L1887_17005 [Cichorium endivia]|nr:hypothetical protein L1887_17005 [Cichorium endivia]